MARQQRQCSQRRHPCGIECEEPLRYLTNGVHRTGGRRRGDCADQRAGFGILGIVVEALEEPRPPAVVRQGQERPVPRLAQARQLVGDGIVITGGVAKCDAPHHPPPRHHERRRVEVPSTDCLVGELPCLVGDLVDE
jgi:hypothetical protein